MSRDDHRWFGLLRRGDLLDRWNVSALRLQYFEKVADGCACYVRWEVGDKGTDPFLDKVENCARGIHFHLCGWSTITCLDNELTVDLLESTHEVLLNLLI